MKRRTFLVAAITLGGLSAAGCALRRAIPALPSRPEADGAAAAGWIRYEDGRYALILPRVEMGQNISVALKQIAAEELGVDMGDIDLRLHDTDAIEPVRATVGSESVKVFGPPLALACAALRKAVAAGRTNGEVTVTERPLSALRAFRAGGRIVGRSEPPEQGEAIVRGQPLFAADRRLPGMLFGRVLRAPVSPEIESSPLDWNAAAAAAVPGFHAVIEHDAFVQGGSRGLGVLARTPGALDRIAEALDIRWEIGERVGAAEIDAALDVDQRLAAGALRYAIRDEAVAPADPVAGEAVVDLQIETPPAPHAQIEPRCAVAAARDEGGMVIWAGTQDAFFVRDTVAKALALSIEDVWVQTCRVGGGFGGRAICLPEIEAAALAMAAGAPVKVQWTRAQEFLYAYHRPPTRHRVTARVRDGRLADWRHAFTSSHILFTNAGMPRWMQWGTDLVVGDPGVARGADMPYRTPSARIEYDLERLPVLGGPWRGLGAGPNSIAVESAIDECARATGADPVGFRLSHIDDPRLAGVLERAVSRAAESPSPAPSAGARAGRGVACGIYKAMSYAATVADVMVDHDGVVRVAKLWCAHDCGRIVNPGQVRAQCEGNVVWGVSMALHESLTFEDGRIVEETLGESGLPRLPNIPEILVDLLETDAPPTGAGETAIVSAAAAILNAIRDATGVRISRLPVSPDLLRV